MIRKGKISSLMGDRGPATVTPQKGGIVTPNLVVPWHLFGLLSVGDSVIYVLFDDNTGIILHRTDGAGAVGGATDSRMSASIANGALVVKGGNTSSYVEDGTLMITGDEPVIVSVVDGALVVAY